MSVRRHSAGRHVLTDFLTVTDDQYDAVRAELDRNHLGLSLTRKRWLDPQSWTVIPDGEGRPSKAELFVRKSTDLSLGHVMVNLWFAPDIRRRRTPWPHSHPSEFTSSIVLGAYTEMRYWRVNDGVFSEECGYGQGDTNAFPLDRHHEVVEVVSGTATVMTWGPILQAGKWGYLNINSGAFTCAADDPGRAAFQTHLRDVNPQHFGEA